MTQQLDVVDLIQRMIRNECVNDGSAESGHERRSVDLLRSELDGSGVDFEVYEPVAGRASLVGRIEGSDPSAPSLCWLGHTDVVPANPDTWSRDPFGGELVEGEVWGRGAVDMLNITASMAVAFDRLARGGFRPKGTLVLAAVADREHARMDPVPIQVHAVVDHYVSGEETALIRWLNGGDAKPVQAPPLPYQRGVRRLPTLVDNVETLAHIALIARYGPGWFRQAGRPDAPGTMLVTISGAVDYPGVREIELGTSVGEVLARSGMAGSVGAVLVGGYFGSWHDVHGIADDPQRASPARRVTRGRRARCPPGGRLRAHRDGPRAGLPRRAERPAMRPVHVRACLDRR